MKTNRTTMTAVPAAALISTAVTLAVCATAQASEHHPDESGAQQQFEVGAAANERKPDTRRRAVLEEVVVTAQRRAEQLQDVPMSITAISGDSLSAAGLSNGLDLANVVPGLAVTEAAPGRQTIIIRGIFSGRGTSSLTGVYLDEIPISGIQDGGFPTYPDVRAYDLERVEVLKGPQGTLFGEGAAGGVVRFITNDPDLSDVSGELSSRIYNTKGGDWSEEVSGVANLPLARDVFGVRVSGTYEDKSGWIDQPTVGKENINDSEMKHARVKAMIAPSEKLKVKALVELHRDKGGATNTVNQIPYEDSQFRQAYDVTLPTNYVSDYDLFNLTATYDFGFAELMASSSYGEFQSTASVTELTPENPPYLEVWTSYNYESSIMAHEMRLASVARGPLQWTIGMAYKDSDFVSRQPPGGYISYISLFGGEFSLDRPWPAGGKPTSTSESWAGFGDVSYRFLNHFEIGGGLRYFKDTRESFDPGFPQQERLSGSFDKPTYRTYAKYIPADGVNIYASLATGFRSGNFNSASSVALGAPPTIDPENSQFYELGTKLDLLGQRLRLDVALFYGEYSDMQEQALFLSPVTGDLVGIQINGQDAEVRGVEWDFRWRVTQGLTVSLSGDITDTEVTHIKPGVNSPYHEGDPISRVPEYSVVVGAGYDFDWSASVPGFAMISFSREGESSYALRNSAVVPVGFVTVPEKNFLDASIGADWDTWRLGLFGKNLLNESRLLFATASGWAAQARPRTIGISVAKKF